jgi:D-beta-D-heptose 7-phosphate kinase/D-beta-D-heptose 1-phosphate adenosyltransferase
MNVIIIGDIILDINYLSTITRNAPEANHIPVHKIHDVEYILGGAANVAYNLSRLGINVELISCSGKSEYHHNFKKITNILNEKNVKFKLFIDRNKKYITTKNRIIHNNNICARYDVEDDSDISEDVSNEILSYIKSKINVTAILISDYNKGVITDYLCTKVISYCNEGGIYTFIDPKIKNIYKYKNCFCFKPNMHESIALTKTTDISNMFVEIKNSLQNTHTIITDGQNGLYVDNVSNHITHDKKFSLVDVTGAGDVVISVLLYCFLTFNKDILNAAFIANYIGGKSVQVLGNYAICLKDIEEGYSILNLKQQTQEQQTQEQQTQEQQTQEQQTQEQQTQEQQTQKNIFLDTDTEELKSFQNKNVVFTNGCFDIVHSGHLKLLNYCRKQGEIFIVGLNSDESIKKLKGDSRPINSISERSEFLLDLNIVDYVVIFNDDTPYNVINMIRPKTLVKGGDYCKESIVGSELVDTVLIYDFIENKSSTRIINKILNSQKH